VDLATDPTETVEGYLRVSPDAYGAWEHPSFGGGGDCYNPVGPLNAQDAAFTNGFHIFVGRSRRELLSNSVDWQDLCGDDATLERQVTQPSQTFDDDGNGVADRAVSQFEVTGTGVDLTFDLV
jgi:hypothetical protein